jgi:hypothetical protein
MATPKNIADQRRQDWERAHPASGATRRLFLKTLGLGAAGLAAGGGAAWVAGEFNHSAASAEELRAQLLAALEANAALQGEASATHNNLTLAVDQNTQLVTSLSNAQTEAASLQTQVSTLQSQLDVTASQLEAANAQVAKTQTLIALFDQLESLGFDDLTQTGLAAMGQQLVTSVESLPMVRDGLALARTLLNDFEATLPSWDESLNWVSEQLGWLSAGLGLIEQAAGQVISATFTGLTEIFQGFINFILDHLPFNIGARTTDTLNTTQAVLARLPTVMGDLDTKVVKSFKSRVGPGEEGWSRTLIRPLREKALAPADKLAASFKDTETTFATALKAPVEAALEQRAILRAAIAQYRAENQL